MLKEYNGSTWQGKAYSKIVDTTQQVTSFPVVVRPMENTIPSWTIKGNMQQSGTPTSQNPITPSECGERTGNLFDKDNYNIVYGYFISEGTTTITAESNNNIVYIPCKPNTTYTVSKILSKRFGIGYTIDKPATGVTVYGVVINYTATSLNVTTDSSAKYLVVYIRNGNSAGESSLSDIVNSLQITESSTPLPYQPYGYKLDIKSANTTTPVYLGKVESTRKIKKYEITGLEGWITRSGTPENEFFCERQGTNFINNAAICSHYANQDSGSFDDLQDKHFIVKIASSGDKTYFGIRDSSYPSTNEGANQLKTYLQQQYANGTPVCVWYVLATPQTAVVNEPLRKIGDYADTVSGTNLSVTAQSPTTIDVDTSLKPSEMDLTYTGLKMCERKKRVNGAWV